MRGVESPSLRLPYTSLPAAHLYPSLPPLYDEGRGCDREGGKGWMEGGGREMDYGELKDKSRGGEKRPSRFLSFCLRRR